METETVWPDGYDAPPDGWEWTLVDVTCSSCGASNKLHEQPPQWLTTPEGVVWECTPCGAKNRLGGQPKVEPSDTVAECAECHRTFDPATLEVDEDGAWPCPGCSVVNRTVGHAESASAADRVVAS